MICYLCESESFVQVEGKVRDRPEIKIVRCNSCGLVRLESFDHISKEYYDSGYSEETHGEQSWDEYLKECHKDDERRFHQILPFITKKRVLDVGCGGGGVLMKIKSYCASASGVEPLIRWRNALSQQHIRMYGDISEVTDRSQDIVTLFHVIEHIADPISFLKAVVAKLAPGGMLFMETPNADDALLTLYQSRVFSEFTYWSPHLFLYSAYTLRTLLQKSGVSENIVIQQYQRYPLSNHLFWLAQGKPGGHEKWFFLDSPELTGAYANSLAGIGKCDTLIAVVRVSSI